MKRTRWLNNPISHPSRYHPVYRTDEGEYKVFRMRGKKIVMDVNTLDLFQPPDNGDPVAPPMPVLPQFVRPHMRTIKQLALNVTHACQLRCDYCYLSHFYPEMEAKMGVDTAIRAVDELFNHSALDKLPDDYTGRGPGISFFGGEPLLNFPLIEAVVAHARSRSKHFRFGVTTNGVAVTPSIAKFLAENKFSMIVSVDGPKALHDKHRKFPDGNGCFDSVVEGLEMLRDAGVEKITLRSTFLPDETELLERTKYLNELCDNNYAQNVSIEPACLSEGCAFDGEVRFTVANVKKLQKEYLVVADWLASRIIDDEKARFHNIMSYVDRLVNKKQYCTECGAGVGFLAVSPVGKICACHREMNSEIGDLERGGVCEKARAPWFDNRYYLCQKCTRCKIRNLCGGPCREHNITAKGDMHTPDPVFCEFYNIWAKAAVSILDQVEHKKLQELFPAYKKRQPTIVRKAVEEEYAFVREAGGFGDIVSIGAAARCLKHEKPDCHITLYVPGEFKNVVQHLKGVDEMVSLGSLRELVDVRRKRGTPFSRADYPYLEKVDSNKKLVDMWGPAHLYESTAEDFLKQTRSQIFAEKAGCKDVSHAIPYWKVTSKERKEASEYLKTLPLQTVIALAPRGTDVNRSLPKDTLLALLDKLKGRSVLFLDCVAPDLPERFENVHFPEGSLSQAAALIEQSDILISVDTSLLHIGVGVGTPTLGIFNSTDPSPYEGFYPGLQTVWWKGDTPNCMFPCNRSRKKGYGPWCKDACDRRKNLGIKEIMEGLSRIQQLANNPALQMKRVERMKHG